MASSWDPGPLTNDGYPIGRSQESLMAYTGRWPPQKIGGNALNSGDPSVTSLNSGWSFSENTQIWGFTQIWGIPRRFAQIWVLGELLGIVFICIVGKGSQCENQSHLLIGVPRELLKAWYTEFLTLVCSPWINRQERVMGKIEYKVNIIN